MVVSIAVLVRVLIEATCLRLERMAIRHGGSSLFPEQARGSRQLLFDAAAGAWDRRLGGVAVSPIPLECLATSSIPRFGSEVARAMTTGSSGTVREGDSSHDAG